MKLRRILAAGAAIVAVTLPAIPVASAASDTAHCGIAVTDDSSDGAINQSAVAATVQGILQANPNIEVYVRAVTPLNRDVTPSVYNDQFRAVCNPATDYMLVALDNHGFAGVFYGSYFARLTPVLDIHSGQFLTDFYGSDGLDKTAAVVRLLDNFRTTLAQNPDFADYNKYPTSYAAIGPVLPHGDAPGMFTTKAKVLAGMVGALLVAIAFAIVAMARDKKDHRWD